MNSADRSKTIRFIWSVSFILVLMMIISTSWLNEFSGSQVLLGGIVLVVSMIATLAISESKLSSGDTSDSSTQGKIKNDDHMNRILGRMSDTDLMRLRDSLQEYDERSIRNS